MIVKVFQPERGLGGRLYVPHVLTADRDTAQLLRLAMTPATFALQRMIERLRLDDVLVCGRGTLEYLYLEAGVPHYRFYYGTHTVGLVDIASDKLLAVVQRYLANYLYSFGWTVEKTTRLIGEARTPLNAGKRRTPTLFTVITSESYKRTLARQGLLESTLLKLVPDRDMPLAQPSA